MFAMKPFRLVRAVKAPPEPIKAGLKAPLPLENSPCADLDRVLAEAYMAQDARALWITHPGLRQSTERTLEMLSLRWPLPTDHSRSACASAIVEGFTAVKKGIGEGQDTYDLVLRNFLRGLLTVADAVTRMTAVGMKAGRPIEQYDPNNWNFVAWANEGRFDEVQFVPRETFSQVDERGTRWKFICQVADSRTVGLVDLHK